jgi:hypothetical protein
MLVDPLTTTTKHPLFKTLNPKYDPKKNKTPHLSHYLRVVEYANLKVKNLGS